jgi:hypothetical protein
MDCKIKINQDDKEDIISRFAKGVEVQIIAELAGKDRNFVINLLESEGFEVREKVPGKLKGKEEEIMELMRAGKNDREVASKYEVHPSAVYLWRKNRGILPACHRAIPRRPLTENKPGPVFVTMADVKPEVKKELPYIGGGSEHVDLDIRNVQRLQLPLYAGIGATLTAIGLNVNHDIWKYDITHSNQSEFLMYDV